MPQRSLTPPLSGEDHVDGPDRAELDPATFFVNGRLHEGPFDAGSLAAALEA